VRFRLEEEHKFVLIPLEDSIMLKSTLNPLRELRGILRKEIDVQKASRLIREIRRDWRLD